MIELNTFLGSNILCQLNCVNNNNVNGKRGIRRDYYIDDGPEILHGISTIRKY